MIFPALTTRTHKPSIEETADDIWRQDPIWNGLVGAWFFNEGGGLTAYDVSGYRNQGTLTNGPIWIVGKYGSALDFDGVDEYINIGTQSTIDVGGGAHTLSAWIRGTNYVLESGIISIENWAGRKISLQITYNDASKLAYARNGSYQYSAGSGLNDGNWHHVTATYDTAILLYIDGKNVSYTTGTTNHASNNRIASGLFGYFRGQIDLVTIFSRALSPYEISQLYLNPFPDVRRRVWFVPSAVTAVIRDTIGMGVIPYQR